MGLGVTGGTPVGFNVGVGGGGGTGGTLDGIDLVGLRPHSPPPPKSRLAPHPQTPSVNAPAKPSQSCQAVVAASSYRVLTAAVLIQVAMIGFGPPHYLNTLLFLLSRGPSARPLQLPLTSV